MESNILHGESELNKINSAAFPVTLEQVCSCKILEREREQHCTESKVKCIVIEIRGLNTQVALSDAANISTVFLKLEFRQIF